MENALTELGSCSSQGKPLVLYSQKQFMSLKLINELIRLTESGNDKTVYFHSANTYKVPTTHRAWCSALEAKG